MGRNKSKIRIYMCTLPMIHDFWITKAFELTEFHADFHEWHGFNTRIESIFISILWVSFSFQLHFIGGANSFSSYRWNSACRFVSSIIHIFAATYRYRWRYYCFQIFMEIMIRSVQWKRRKYRFSWKQIAFTSVLTMQMAKCTHQSANFEWVAIMVAIL